MNARTQDATGAHVRPRGCFTSESAYNRQFDEARSPEARVDELLDAMTPARERAIVLEQRAHERRIVGEAGHGDLPPLEFTGSHLTLGEMLQIIADVEADQSIEVANVLREPTTGKRIGLAFRLGHR